MSFLDKFIVKTNNLETFLTLFALLRIKEFPGKCIHIYIPAVVLNIVVFRCDCFWFCVCVCVRFFFAHFRKHSPIIHLIAFFSILYLSANHWWAGQGSHDQAPFIWKRQDINIFCSFSHFTLAFAIKYVTLKESGSWFGIHGRQKALDSFWYLQVNMLLNVSSVFVSEGKTARNRPLLFFVPSCFFKKYKLTKKNQRWDWLKFSNHQIIQSE